MNKGSDNERRAKEILNELSPKARPRNGAWQRLEEIGYSFDWSEADAGMHRSDNE